MQPVQVPSPENRLRELRKRQGRPLRDIALPCGVYESTVYRWESEGPIPAKHQGTVARVLDVSVPYLTGWSSVEEPFKEAAA